MRYKVIYENNRGQRVNLSERPYFLNIEPILDYQWSYSEKEKRRGNIIAGFAKDIQSVDLTLHIMDANADARDEAVDYFNNVIEADIYDGIAGRLIIGDWYTWGYIIASKNTKWQYGKPVVKKTIKLVREQENWYHIVQKANYGSEQAEELYNFIEEDIKTYEGADTNSLKSLKATIDPKQDLHGYDKPWVGGGGKNLFGGVYGEDFELHIPNGATVTAYADKACTVAYYDANDTRIDYWSIATAVSGGYARTFTMIGDSTYFRFLGASDTPTKMQIEISSSFTSFEPYSNICPISGWDSVEATLAGDNLVDDTLRNYTNTVTLPAGTWYAQAFIYATSEINTRLDYINENGNWASVLSSPFETSTFTTEGDYTFGWAYPAGANPKTMTLNVTKPTTFRFNTASLNNTRRLSLSRVRKTSISDFVEYQVGETKVSTLPETVYGGSLDVVNGVLTVDRAMVTYDDSEGWGLNQSGNGRFYLGRLPSGIISGVDKALSISNQATYKDSASVYGAYFGFGSSGLYVNKLSADDALDAFKARLASNPLQIVYPLAEPHTVQLTSKQVTTLLGTNNVWADSGDVTVEYWDDAGRIKTASGSVVTFSKYNVLSGAGYDYPYDYMADAQSQKRIENPNSVPCDFSITIQGYVDRPEVQIGDNVIAFDLEVPYGAFLTVDSSKKTAIMTLANGEQVNVFGARDPDYYLFERIKEGKNTVTWNGSFLWEIKMLEERSEPRWRMD